MLYFSMHNHTCNRNKHFMFVVRRISYVFWTCNVCEVGIRPRIPVFSKSEYVQSNLFTKTKMKRVSVSFCTPATCRWPLAGPICSSKTKRNSQPARFCATCRILEFRHNANKNLFQAFNTLSSYTDHVTKEEGRTASGHNPKGIAAYYSGLYLQWHSM